MKKRYKYLENIRNVQEEFEMKETPDGNYQLNIAFPKSVLVDELKHHYCLKKDEHSANIYLNIGAAGKYKQNLLIYSIINSLFELLKDFVWAILYTVVSY